MNDMYIDVMCYMMENTLHGFDMESDEDEIMEWLVSQGDDVVDSMLHRMIDEYGA